MHLPGDYSRNKLSQPTKHKYRHYSQALSGPISQGRRCPVTKSLPVKSRSATISSVKIRQGGEFCAKQFSPGGFLPCDAVSHGLSYRNSVRPSVCPSVRLSVTLVHCVHIVRPTIMISSPYDSSIILVFGDIMLIPKFEGGHPERGR